MLELMAPASSQEGVIAAVQSGADSIYIGFREPLPDERDAGFDDAGLENAVRYCRVRGCRTYALLDGFYSDDTLADAARRAKLASDLGVDAIILSDFGLARALRRLCPQLPLFAGPRSGIHSLGGAEAAKELGFVRCALTPELSAVQISHIASRAPLETEISVHGPLCIAHLGQCRYAAFLTRHADSRGICDAPCRLNCSMGGRMDEYPLSLKDASLLEHMDELRRTGVSALRIDGMGERPEYIASVTESFRKVMDNGKPLTPQETAELLALSPTGGWTDGYFTGERGNAMFGLRTDIPKDASGILSAARKRYAGSERRRVPVEFYAIIKKDRASRFAARDEDGFRAAVDGPVPGPAVVRRLTETAVEEELYRTGGTPFACVSMQCIVDDGIDLPPEALAEARSKLLSELTRQRRRGAQRVTGPMPPPPADIPLRDKPKLIVQVSGAGLLTEELAALKPDFIYLPLELLVDSYELLRPFVLAGAQPVVVLPPVITDSESGPVISLLSRARELGVTEALADCLGHVLMARRCGMRIRGGLGLDASNSQALGIYDDAGFESVTLSCELKLSQIKELKKPLDTELIAYGRVPVMTTDHCIIKNSSGRCACQNPNHLSDRLGSVFPVQKQFGCRNTVYSARKIFLADKKQDYEELGLWAIRLLFTTESPRECVQIVKSYMGLLGYRPNNLTRGLYYRGSDIPKEEE